TSVYPACHNVVKICVDVVEVEEQRSCVCLRVCVDKQASPRCVDEPNCKVDRSKRLRYATFLRCDCDPFRLHWCSVPKTIRRAKPTRRCVRQAVTHSRPAVAAAPCSCVVVFLPTVNRWFGNDQHVVR